MEKKCFKKKFYIYYIKIGTRSPFFNLIIILDNKDINKLSPPSFYINIVMENKNTKNIKDKKNLKNLQLSYLKFPLSFINKNILNNPLSKSNISSRTEKPAKRKKKIILKYK